jgi:hypothetical protein
VYNFHLNSLQINNLAIPIKTIEIFAGEADFLALLWVAPLSRTRPGPSQMKIKAIPLSDGMLENPTADSSSLRSSE